MLLFFHYMIESYFTDRAVQRTTDQRLPCQAFDGRKITVSHVTLSANGFGNDVKQYSAV
jgi:hypothetical protein